MSELDDIDDIVNDKNIIIVGPAACVFDDVKDIKFDDYDLIVRINHHYLKEPLDRRDLLGPRTDIVYHFLGDTDNFETNLEYYNKNNILIVNRSPGVKHKARIKNLYNIKKAYIKEVNKKVGCGVQTGVLSIIHLLEYDIKSVTVCGFDFYTTLYSYREDEKLRMKHINGYMGRTRHFPKLQLEYIKKEVYEKDKRFIPVGFLKKLLESS